MSSTVRWGHTPFRILLLLWVTVALPLCSMAGPLKAYSFNEADTFPVPPPHPDMMFYLQRTPNTNTIVYGLNFDKEDRLNAAAPIRVYWIRYTEPGHPVRDLNYIQRTFAYGVKTKQTGKDTWELKIVAYDKLPLMLRKGNDGNYHVYAHLDNKPVIFRKAYIKITEKGTFWNPDIPYIELTGTDLATGKEMVHRIKPK